MVGVAPFTATFSGTVSPQFTARYIFDGKNKIVTITMPHNVFHNTGATTGVFNSSNLALPPEIKPATGVIFSVPVRIASGSTFLPMGIIVIYSTGQISICTADNAQSFISGQLCGTSGITTITYMI